MLVARPQAAPTSRLRMDIRAEVLDLYILSDKGVCGEEDTDMTVNATTIMMELCAYFKVNDAQFDTIAGRMDERLD
ncbi:hypothetical protein NDU88_002444 [Pleurodeles waltl]|uniref:Uncharacterized protein n=1 Tax=Pleurodeles waltl TaxID=8319 RepID=A0AAV7RAA0_PLEWA|nr:hypothetical protein NDU88_002444 [Pleurodeles waltl]